VRRRHAGHTQLLATSQLSCGGSRLDDTTCVSHGHHSRPIAAAGLCTQPPHRIDASADCSAVPETQSAVSVPVLSVDRRPDCRRVALSCHSANVTHATQRNAWSSVNNCSLLASFRTNGKMLLFLQSSKKDLRGVFLIIDQYLLHVFHQS